MKKIVSVVFVLLLIACMALAMADVSFNSVEFLSTDDIVLNTLTEKGFVKNNTVTDFSNEKNIYLVTNELLGFQPTYNPYYQDVCYSQTASGYGRIAGYPVKGLSMTYAYDGSYRLISVKVDLIGADYATLLEKLTKVYGTAEVKAVEDEGITSNIWKDGVAAIVLYTESDGADYILMYGRLDAEEILTNCLVSDPDDISGL